ncbi:MAG: hypothetical protein RLZZ210_1131 [Pseudomonadota bacterium]|jgi:GTP-binding protein
MPFFFQQAAFNITVAETKGLPDSTLPEIAFVGRSNAGKSSAINALTNQKQLAHMSKMPGRTQHLNFFDVIRKKESVGFLVDLPGYGYAKTTKQTTKNWDGFLGQYLVSRQQLKGLVLVMDCRRPVTDLDEIMIRWFAKVHKPIHILLNKSDKLNNEEKVKSIRICKEKINSLKLPHNLIEIQLFSSSKKQGVEELSKKLQTWLNYSENTEE